MFAMMIGVNAVCVSLMLLVTTEVPLPLTAKPEEGKQSVLAPVLSIFRSMLRIPNFLLQSAVVQTLAWCGIGMLNKNSSLWFGITLFHGSSTAVAGSAEKVAFDHGIAAYSTAGVFQSSFMVVASLAMFLALLKTRTSLRYLYASCLLGGALSFLAFCAVGDNILFAQSLVVLAKIAETSTFVVPYALVVIANKAAESNGAEVNTAMQMSLLNCYSTLGQLLSMALTSLLFATMSESKAIPSTFLLGALCQFAAAAAVILVKNLFSAQNSDDKVNDRKVPA